MIDKEHMAFDFEMRGSGDWFSAQLFRLIEKADHHNLERLRKGFPEHVDFYEEWRIRSNGPEWSAHLASRFLARKVTS